MNQINACILDLTANIVGTALWAALGSLIQRRLTQPTTPQLRGKQAMKRPEGGGRDAPVSGSPYVYAELIGGRR